MTYRPRYFRNDDPAMLLSYLAEHPLATLVTTHDGQIELTHLPLMASSGKNGLVLEGHIARANDQWRYAATAAVAIFRIAGHYVSPTWYPSKRNDPRTVPTYDYVAIEARGPVRFIHDRDWLATFVSRLSDDQEARVGGTWSVRDAPESYIESQLHAIVGVEMRVESLTGTFKLHQNHPAENIDNVERELRALDTPESVALAKLMNPPFR